MIASDQLQRIIEGALLASEEPLSLARLASLFADDELGEAPHDTLRAGLTALGEACAGRGIELVKVASGWRLQVSAEVAHWVGRLQEERPQRYSRALLETLAIVAYRQPVTRGDIEDIRGVAVSSNIMRTLTEREWVHVVGHRDVPGRPAMYATTRAFLDYFGLDSLQALPPLAEIRDLDEIGRVLELDLGEAQAAPADSDSAAPRAADSAESAAGDADDDADDDDAAAAASESRPSNVVELGERGREAGS